MGLVGPIAQSNNIGKGGSVGGKPLGLPHALWRPWPDSNRRVAVLQTAALATWRHGHIVKRFLHCRRII